MSPKLELVILTLRGIPHTVERTIAWLHVPAGRTDRWMRWVVIATSVQGLALLCGLPFGAVGVTIAGVVSLFILFIPAVVYAVNVTLTVARDFLPASLRQYIRTPGMADIQS